MESKTVNVVDVKRMGQRPEITFNTKTITPEKLDIKFKKNDGEKFNTEKESAVTALSERDIKIKSTMEGRKINIVNVNRVGKMSANIFNAKTIDTGDLLQHLTNIATKQQTDQELDPNINSKLVLLSHSASPGTKHQDQGSNPSMNSKSVISQQLVSPSTCTKQQGQGLNPSMSSKSVTSKELVSPSSKQQGQRLNLSAKQEGQGLNQNVNSKSLTSQPLVSPSIKQQYQGLNLIMKSKRVWRVVGQNTMRQSLGFNPGRKWKKPTLKKIALQGTRQQVCGLNPNIKLKSVLLPQSTIPGKRKQLQRLDPSMNLKRSQLQHSAIPGTRQQGQGLHSVVKRQHNLQAWRKNKSADTHQKSTIDCDVTFNEENSNLVDAEMLTCKLCSERFKGEEQLNFHLSIHENDSVYDCDLCNKRFSCKTNLIEHRKTHSSDLTAMSNSSPKKKLLYWCDVCKSEFHRKDEFMKHMKMSNILHEVDEDIQIVYDCDYCNQRFSQLNDLLSHKKGHDHSDDGYQMYKRLNVFGNALVNKTSNGHQHTQEFPVKEKLNSHVTSSHNDVSFKCMLCDDLFNTFELLMVHQKTHSVQFNENDDNSTQELHCVICSESFKTSFGLQRHRKTHSLNNKQKFKCETCGSRYNEYETLKRHQVIHADTIDSQYMKMICGLENFRNNDSSPVSVSVMENMVVICPFCKKLFSNYFEMKIHMNEIHSYEVEQVKNGKDCEAMHDLGKSSKPDVEDDGKTDVTYLKVKKNEKGKILLSEIGEDEVAKNSNNSGNDELFTCDVCNKHITLCSQILEHGYIAKNLIYKPGNCFKCKFCESIFPYGTCIEKYLNHLQMHTGGSPYQCKVKDCGQWVSNKDILELHMASHRENVTYWCDICETSLKDLDEIRVHMKQHEEVSNESSRYLSETHSSSKSLEIDISDKVNLNNTGKRSRFIIDKDNTLSWQKDVQYCPEPGVTNLCQDDVRKGSTQEVDVNLKGDNNFGEISEENSSAKVRDFQKYMQAKILANAECYICDAQFCDKESRRKHLQKVHIDLKQFKCDICGDQFSLSRSYTIHMQSHINKTCAICQKTYNLDFTKMREHLEHHMIVSGAKSLKRKRHLMRNMIFKDRGRRNKIHTYIGKFERDKNRNMKANQHGKICGICGEQYKGKFIRHMSKHYTDIFKCDFCDQTFTSKDSIQIHFRKHTNDKPFKCKLCKLSFALEYRLQRHLVMVHKVEVNNEERPFQCDICQKKFKTRTNLKYHLLSHTSVREHLCHVCGVGHKVLGDLNRHMKQHNIIKDHLCNICGATHVNLADLKQHLKQHVDGQINLKSAGVLKGATNHTKWRKKTPMSKPKKSEKLKMRKLFPKSSLNNNDRGIYASKRSKTVQTQIRNSQNIFNPQKELTNLNMAEESSEAAASYFHHQKLNKGLEKLQPSFATSDNHERHQLKNPNYFSTDNVADSFYQHKERIEYLYQEGHDIKGNSEFSTRSQSLNKFQELAAAVSSIIENEDQYNYIDEYEVNVDEPGKGTYAPDFFTQSASQQDQGFSDNISFSNDDVAFEVEVETQTVDHEADVTPPVVEINPGKFIDVSPRYMNRFTDIWPFDTIEDGKSDYEKKLCSVGFKKQMGKIIQTDSTGENNMKKHPGKIIRSRINEVKVTKNDNVRKGISVKSTKNTGIGEEVKIKETNSVSLPIINLNVENQMSSAGTNQSDVNTEKSSHDKTDDVVCENCNEVFDSWLEKQAHRTYKHNNSGLQRQCFICNKMMTRYSILRHVPIHTGKGFKIICQHCGKGFMHESNLKVHKITHLKERSFSCNICDKKFYHACHVKRHIREVHQRIKTKICEICGKGFANSYKLNEHLRSHNKVRPYKCDHCKKTFRDSTCCRKHQEKCLNRRQTGIAFEKYFTSDLEPFEKSDLNERHFRCLICDKKFLNSGHVKRHIQEVHHRIQTDFCDVCGKGFVNNYKLKEHLRSHYNIRPYKCKYCKSTFSSSRYCKRHQEKCLN